MANMKVIGADPASGKDTCLWFNDGFEFIAPGRVRSRLAELLEGEESVLLSWDAPLSFCKKSFSDRQIDKAARRWAKTMVEAGRLALKAVNALPFSGLSHWVISCESLGYPFGETLSGLQLYPGQKFEPEHNGKYLVEVHPAVSMAFMWLDQSIKEPFPRYKNDKGALKAIVSALSLPDACTESDDVLDAYIAYRMSDMFVNGLAQFPNDPLDGSYVLPLGNNFDEFVLRYPSSPFKSRE